MTIFCPWLLWWLRGKLSACDIGESGEAGLISGLERSLEKEMATHSRIPGNGQRILACSVQRDAKELNKT